MLRCCSLSRSLFLVLRMCREKQILKTTKKRAVQAKKKQTDDDEKKNLFFPFVFKTFLPLRRVLSPTIRHDGLVKVVFDPPPPPSPSLLLSSSSSDKLLLLFSLK